MDIEFFPAEKSCEQGCRICPLARKDRVFGTTEKDARVQRSFTRIESLLKKHHIRYNLHTTSALPHLFPTLRHPDLITMARFETSKDIRMNGNPEEFSHHVRTLCADHGLNPRVLAFSIVPQIPLISSEDVELIDRIINGIKSWYFARSRKTIEVTIRSNFIDQSVFNAIEQELFLASRTMLKPLMHRHATLKQWYRKPKHYTMCDGKMFYHEYQGNTGTHHLVIKNRVMTDRKVDDLKELHREQALASYPTKNVISLAIAPRGIMINHSSLAINNPILWISHDDFSSTLARESKKKDFTLLRCVQNIVRENVGMYAAFPQSLLKKNAVVTNDHWIALFEKYRPEVSRIYKSA